MQFTKKSFIRASPNRVFAFHELPDAFARLLPPWESATIVQTADISVLGSQAIIDTKLFGLFTTRWIAEHTAYKAPQYFEDVQISGPFKRWWHRHIVEPREGGAMLRDEIDFEPPVGVIGALVAPILIFPKLERMFEYRHQVTKAWCEADHVQE